MKILERIETESTPLIDGNAVTFVWQGAESPLLRGDFNGWNPDNAPDWQEESPGLWICQMEFPADAYIEYCFGRDQERQPDPLNPRVTSNGMGEFNHYFYMPEAAPTPLAQPRRGVLRGKITRHILDTYGLVAGKRRTVSLYRPPTNLPTPLMVVYDGRDYERRANLLIMVNNLIAEGRIRPLSLALVPNGGDSRMAEYACSEATLLFLRHQVLPLAHDKLNLIDIHQQPGAYGVMGASMGGLMSLFTGLRMPDVFGRVLSQSGAFHFEGYSTVVNDLLPYATQKPRIWMDVGRFEWLLESNRLIHTALQQYGYSVAYREYNAGHNYPAWRDDLWRGLEWLFPG